MHFDLSDIPLEWIPSHPVASTMINLFNVVLPAAEHWFVKTFNEALPLVKDPKLADDMRGFIGQEAMHAAAHDEVMRDFLIGNGVDPAPMLEMVEYMFEKVLAPTTSTDPKRQLNNLCERLWLIAAIEHYTAVLGDFALNSTWDDHGADPTMVDLFRWHGSEEVEHRSVAHDVAVYFHNSYPDRIRADDVGGDGDLRLLPTRHLVPAQVRPCQQHRLVADAAPADARLQARAAARSSASCSVAIR